MKLWGGSWELLNKKVHSNSSRCNVVFSLRLLVWIDQLFLACIRGWLCNYWTALEGYYHVRLLSAYRMERIRRVFWGGMSPNRFLRDHVKNTKRTCPLKVRVDPLIVDFHLTVVLKCKNMQRYFKLFFNIKISQCGIFPLQPDFFPFFQYHP